MTVAVLATIATGAVLWGVANAMGMFALSRVSRRTAPSARPLRFVFVVPALNESGVIAATVRHLLKQPTRAVVVVDDGSDDGTAAVVASIDDPRVVLVRRRRPHARRGKGDALNAAYRRIVRTLSAGMDPADIIVCVVDADGRLEPPALDHAARAFADPSVGACQVAVRIRNRRESVWTAMQHFEFVAFAALYQRGREWTGSVGLGGNGQFVRLSALRSLGDAPWSACLTEDMDLGIRLLLAGWRTRFLGSSWVSQQAVPDLRRLFRQRVRWFQGTLQCLRHLPAVVASTRLPLAARMDLAGTLATPLLLLALAPVMLLGTLILALSLPAVAAGASPAAQLVPAYGIVIAVPLLLGFTYWRHEPGASLPRSVAAAHGFALYGLLWPAVGWRALFLHLRRRDGWVRTPRVREDDPRPAMRVVVA